MPHILGNEREAMLECRSRHQSIHTRDGHSLKAGLAGEGSRSIEKRPLPPGQSLVADFRRVSPGYLATMGIPLLRGRLLSSRDVRDAPPVILIDETLAHQYWPNEDPLGRRMRLWGEFRQVVGVLGQVHHYGLEKQPEPTIYAPYEQMPDKAMALAVRRTPRPW